MDKWDKAAAALKKGGVVIIPSDSSFGLAAIAENHEAVEKLYQIKSRDKDKPSLIIVGSVAEAEQLVDFTPLAKKLAKKYWPGGLTLILKATDLSFPKMIYGRGKTLAVRLPNHFKLQQLALKVGPLILPSANLTDHPAPYTITDIDSALIENCDYFLDEPTKGAEVSTLVDARGDKPKVIRQGQVSLD